MIIIWLI